MYEWLLIAAILVAVFATGLLLYERNRNKKMLDSLENMLREARNGVFSEYSFDESRLSKIESEFVDYLNNSESSAKSLAQEKDKIKALITDISHQTKTPIANLILYSELLRESNLSEEQKENADAIYNQSEKLRFLIESLVKLSRLDNGIIQPSPQRERIADVMQAVYDEMLPKASAKGLSFTLELSDVYALFDLKWTTEALSNIVDNAIKYTKEGTVHLSCREYDLFARIDVSDTGIGISEHEQPKIFRRFYRANGLEKEEGVGIGLFLAREIISAQGGYIKVTSEVGKGSLFSIFLPRL